MLRLWALTYDGSIRKFLTYKEPKSKFDAWRKEYFDQDTPPDLMTLKHYQKNYKTLVLPTSQKK